MSVCDSASVDIESGGTIAAGETATIAGTDFPPCNSQANSTVLRRGAKRRIYLWTMKLNFLGNCRMDKDSEVRTRP